MRPRPMVRRAGATLALATALVAAPAPHAARAQNWTHFAGNEHHTAISRVAVQAAQSLRWSVPIDSEPPGNGELAIHYGSPVVSNANTVFVPIKGGTNGSPTFGVAAYRVTTGAPVWSYTSDWSPPPSFNWWLPYNVTMRLSTTSNDLAIPAAGGTVILRNQMTSAQGTFTRHAFFGTNKYNSNPDSYNNSVWITTPISADSRGNLYFGYYASGAPGGIASGLAKLTPGQTGSGSWISAASAAGDNSIVKVAYNCAPALSQDERVVYVGVNDANGAGYLVGVATATMAPKYKVRLKDVAHPSNDAWITDDSTASPTVGTDGDVYYGVLENPFPANHDRGWLLHFDSTLATAKTPGAFGWDTTATIVPQGAVPSYKGKSPYLILTKYNNYYDRGGDGVNKVAIQDPDAAMTDPITGASVMSTVLTVTGVTPDQDGINAGSPNAVREWCINSAAVDPTSKVAILNSEDGNLYVWDLTTGSLGPQTGNPKNPQGLGFDLSKGIGEPYTPTVIGPDGSIYAINDSSLFVLGNTPRAPSFIQGLAPGSIFSDRAGPRRPQR